MEKIKFSKFWKSRLIRMLVSGGGILLCISILFLIYTNSLVKKDIALKLADTVQSILTCVDYYEQDVSAVKFSISMGADSWTNAFDGMDYAMAICDTDTKEVIAVSEASAFALMDVEEDVTNILICESEELLKLQKKYEDRSKVLSMKDCYIKGDRFLPGRVEVVEFSTNEAARGQRYMVIEEIDYTPENTEGYTYYSDDDMSLLVYGTDRAGKALQLLDGMIESGKVVTTKKSSFGSYVGESLFIMDKTSYTLYYVCTIDFWKVYGYILVLIWGLGVLIIVGGSWFEADRAYRKYCTQFEIDAYRRHMTSALAHDLKTPLAAIMGYSVNLKENIHSEKKDYYLDAVIENVQYMNDIITGTLELAKVEESTEKLNKTNIELVALAEELLSKYRAGLESRGIIIELSGDFQVMADKNMMSRAIDNLLSNAVKYTPDNGKIMIQANRTAFTVSNTCDKNLNGNTEDFCKAFAKFDNSRSDRKGSGIGLAIVRNVVVLHGLRFVASAVEGIFKAEIRKE